MLLNHKHIYKFCENFVSILTDWKTGVQFAVGARDISFLTSSIPALGSNKSPDQCFPGLLAGDKAVGVQNLVLA
jgi:hypothetical protein